VFRNYLKIAVRNIFRHKGFSFINLIGLAVGIACCLLIFLFVQDELSFDRFHGNADRLYRLNKVFTPQTGGTELHAISSGRMGPAMVEDFPEVERCVRMLPWFSDIRMTRDEKTLKVADVVIADSSFFDVFDFKLLRGDPKTALEKPLSIVLSETTARNFFGEESPIGKTIQGLQDQLYTVTGIAADAPPNSHLRYNALISWSSTVPGVGPLNMAWLNNWLTQAAYTYLLLKPGADPVALEQKFPDFMQRYFAEKAGPYHLYLQPFTEIYLKSGNILFSRNLRLGSFTSVYVFSAVAAFILLIACVNFMNLSTARASRRAKEVGVRKVLGASRRRLARQFLGESLMFSLFTTALAVALVAIALPSFNAFAGKNLAPNLWRNPALLFGLPLLALLVGFLSGSYPAFMLSRFQAARIIKGVWTKAPHSDAPRKILVTAQFAIAIALIAGTAVIYRQMAFTQEKNLGFVKEQVVVLPIGDTRISGQFEAFKTALLRNPNIRAAAGSNSVPSQDMMSFGIRPEGKPETEDWTVATIRVDDYDLLKTYGMEMAAGRYFSADFSTDAANGVVINETLAKSLGWKEPVGKKLDVPGEVADGRVIGVVKDFHMKSLHFPVEPLLLYFAPRHGFLAVRLAARDVPATVDFLRKTWQRFDARDPFDYFFLDERFAHLYAVERRLMRTVGLFSMLAIFIAGLGLFGLAAFAAEQRTKEIGIRKVVGASVSGLILLFSREFLKWVLAANLIAWPVVYFVMRRWLQNFAYRTSIGVGTFFLSAGLALLIAFLTVSYQSVKAALADPVKAIRYE
jgi:putative ABC transport system permease protein